MTRIDKLVLQIGELSSMIPKYIEDCFPCAVDGTSMADTKLEIEILPGNGRCRPCGEVFNMVANRGACPACGAKDAEILSRITSYNVCYTKLLRFFHTRQQP